MIILTVSLTTFLRIGHFIENQIMYSGGRVKHHECSLYAKLTLLSGSNVMLLPAYDLTYVTLHYHDECPKQAGKIFQKLNAKGYRYPAPTIKKSSIIVKKRPHSPALLEYIN